MFTAMYLRAPRPDATVWPGRRLLGVLDALGWAALVCVAVALAGGQMGLVGPVLGGAAVAVGAWRAHRAWYRNHRYHFITARWALVAALLLAVGLALRWVG